MPANMTRLMQVVGMSTRESLDRPRIGVLAWQPDDVQEVRLNTASRRGYDGKSTAVFTKRPAFDGKAFVTNAKFGGEKIHGTDCDVKHLLWQIRKDNPNWQPSRYARKEWRNHPMLRS